MWLTAGPAVVLAVVCLADFAGCGFWSSGGDGGAVGLSDLADFAGCDFWASFNYLKSLYLYLFLFIP